MLQIRGAEGEALIIYWEPSSKRRYINLGGIGFHRAPGRQSVEPDFSIASVFEYLICNPDGSALLSVHKCHSKHTGCHDSLHTY